MNKLTVGDNIVILIFYLFIVLFAVFCLIPFVLVFSCSVTDELHILKYGYNLIPGKVTFDAYSFIFKTDKIFNAYLVTIFVTGAGTLLSIILSSMLAYSISVSNVKYKNHIAFYVFFTMLFNGGLVPSYILISKYLHLKDNIWVLVLPALINPWLMFLLRNFFKTIPASLSESARIDGANDIFILFKIILPLSLPAMATIGLFYALGYWNEWFRALLFIENPKLYPLQYIIMYILRSVDFANIIAKEAGISTQKLIPAYSTRMATTIVTIGPIIFVYPFIQKYFIKGLTVGAIKG